MDAETLEALRGSIAKWKAIVEGTGYDAWGANCPLCRLFIHPIDDCMGCPVYEKAGGKRHCAGTPYVNWNRLFSAEVPAARRRANDENRKAAAQAELDFLISLLPDGAQP